MDQKCQALTSDQTENRRVHVLSSSPDTAGREYCSYEYSIYLQRHIENDFELDFM